jgi:hypothetical protein
MLQVCSEEERKKFRSEEAKRKNLTSLRRGEGTGYFLSRRSQVRVLPATQVAVAQLVEQRKTPEPLIPAARICAVVKAGIPSETESGRINAAR